jgi:arginine decarboxylase
MIGRTNVLIRPRTLIVDDRLSMPATAGGRSVRALAAELSMQNIDVLESSSFADGRNLVASDASIACIFLTWTLGANDDQSHQEGTELLRFIRACSPKVPVFLMADRSGNRSITPEVMGLSDEFVWLLEDTAPFIVGRAQAAMRRYLQVLLPPFTKALASYAALQEYSWAAPGHQGGVAFLKSPVGTIFFETFGEALFRTDMGIERPLGSLLSHSGAIGAAEEYAARVFGAHRSYSVINGTSGSNRAIMSGMVGENEFAICDRNCHKSIEQGLVISGGIPVFLTPSRNRYGIIGPIHPDQMMPEAIAEKIANHPLGQQAVSHKASYAVVTNSTYDGLCYDAVAVQDLFDKSVDCIHFDEAWYAHARFNPLYRNRFAMRGNPADHPKDGPTVFATHSTHKLLAALSQTSYIHVRNGRKPAEHSRFNEAYLLQASTSPLYALIASNEVAAAMMEGPAGEWLTQGVIHEAVHFRQALAQCHREFQIKREWFFWPWNTTEVKDPISGQKYSFADAPAELLATKPECWVLHPGETWHGFENLPDGWCMLDPTKAGIVCPGMGSNGQLEAHGIPAAVLSAYLYWHGVIPSRTTDFMVLPLFSIGVTKGKWGTLIGALLDFKTDYDKNCPLTEVLPELAALAPERYGKMSLRDLAGQMFTHMKANQMDRWQALAFAHLPRPEMSPRKAFLKLQAGEVELLSLEEMCDRVSAVGVIPYPPGIPVVMPGENLGPNDGPWLSYLRTIQEWGDNFPGFEKEVEGALLKGGRYHLWCVKK